MKPKRQEKKQRVVDKSNSKAMDFIRTKMKAGWKIPIALYILLDSAAANGFRISIDWQYPEWKSSRKIPYRILPHIVVWPDGFHDPCHLSPALDDFVDALEQRGFEFRQRGTNLFDWYMPILSD